MSKFEDDDIDKIFEQIIGSEPVNNEEKINLVLKDLIYISQSFSRAIEHVNELMLSFVSEKNYLIDEYVEEILGTMYKISEDFDETMIELMMKDSDIFELDEEDEENE